ncbi:lonely Cys domain-containing protein [Streptomyces sp. FXJ1.4098]|nr:lonely Cys domain-containing protein [Streptomyces sp. FXJ1.4098]
MWAHSGHPTLHETGPQTYGIGVIHRDGRIQGDWIPSRPGTAPDARADDPSWWRKVVNRTLVGLTGLSFGRTALRPEEVVEKDMEWDQRHLDAMKHYAHFNTAVRRFVSGLLPLPRPGKPGTRRYYFDAHGGPGYIVLPWRTAGRSAPGTKRVRGTSRAAGACRSSTRTTGSSWWSATPVRPRTVAWTAPVSTSATASLAPSCPTRSRTSPWAARRERDAEEGQCQHPHRCHGGLPGWIHPGPGHRRPGAAGSYQQYFPEPDAEELDRRAREIGYHTGPGPAPAVAGAATLRLVRALRLTLGKEIDDDLRIDQDPEYAELLRGAAALDRMWRLDPRFADAGPVTLDFFERVVAATLPAGTPARQDDYRNVLKRAAAAPAGTTAATFVALPSSLDDAAHWLDTADVVDAAVRALRLGGPGDVGRRELSRMFWARVKMEEAWGGSDLERITAHLYDLPPSAQVTDRQREFTQDLVTRAFAGGLDGADADVMVAYLLDRNGAVSKTTALSPPGDPDEVIGRTSWGP